MWLPETYSEIETAVGLLSEGPDLDFKLEPSQPADLRDIAKDVAAMSVDGGVIVVGVDEQAGMATAVVPFALAGRVEQIQQVVDTRVRPTPAVRIDALRRQPSDSHGVIVITVGPSRIAPHMVADRYPARSGATTRNCTEREIADLYRRRGAMRDAATSAVGLDDFATPPDGSNQPPQGFGLLRLRVRPIMPIAHAAEPQLRRALSQAVAEAATSLQHFVAPPVEPVAFDWLRRWSPRGSTGWSAGKAPTVDLSPDPRQSVNRYVAATYVYEEGFSFQAVTNLIVPDQSWWSAYEHLWAAETMALLSIAGHFYAAVAAASPLRCHLELTGLAGGLSWFASRGRVNDADAPRVIDTSYTARG